MVCSSLTFARYLALICLMREESFEKQGTGSCSPEFYSYTFLGLIDYNFHCFRQAIQEVIFRNLYSFPFRLMFRLRFKVFEIRRRALLEQSSRVV